MDQIRFRAGEFISFIATNTFDLGNTGQKIHAGMEILFDGTTAEFGGARFTIPTLRGAIKVGWLVLSDQYDPEAPLGPAPSANISIRAAKDDRTNPLAPPTRNAVAIIENDERVVMTNRARQTQANQQTQMARSQVTGIRQQRFAGEIEQGGAEYGQPVPRAFRTPARMEVKVTPDTVGQAIRAADTVKIEPGQGISEAEMLARMTEEQKSEYLARKEAIREDISARGVGYAYSPSPPTNRAVFNQAGSSNGKAVAATGIRPTSSTPVRTATANGGRQGPPLSPLARPVQVVGDNHSVGGIAVSQVQGSKASSGATVGRGSTEVMDLSGTTSQNEQSTVEMEGVTFRNTNGPTLAPKRTFQVPTPQPTSGDSDLSHELPVIEETQSRIEKDGTSDARRAIAKTLCQDFPDEYSFSDHWKRRLAMIRLNFEQRYDVIRAIFAAESDDFKRVLLTEFPEAFAS